MTRERAPSVPRTATAGRPRPALARVHARRSFTLDQAAATDLAVATPSSGNALDEATRRRMEAGFATDLSGVRVHTDAAAARTASALGAAAFTHGEQISFAAGRYVPGTVAGDHLIAHELAHVVQQRLGGPAPALDAAASHETAADLQADRVSKGQAASHPADRAQGTARGVALAPGGPSGPTGGLPPLTPDELMDTMLAQRGFGTSTTGPVSIDPNLVGKPTGYGYRTYAAIQIVDARGNQVAVGLGAYTSRSTPHGEQGAIGALRGSVKPGTQTAGGTMMVAVDQVPCPECDTALTKAAHEFGVERLEIYVPARESMTVPGTTASPKTSSTSAFQGNRPATSARLVRGVTLGPTPAAGSPAVGEPSAAPSAAESGPAPEPSPATKSGPAARPVAEPAPAAAPKSAALEPTPTPTPTPKPAVAPEPALAPEASPTPTPKRGGGGIGGLVGGVLSIALPIVGWAHGRAVEKRIKDQAAKEGYVPFDSPSGHGILYDLGAWFLDPGNSADKAVGLDGRFNFGVWRKKIRDVAAAKKPGETLTMRWDVGRCERDILGNQKIDQRDVVYRKQADGRWKVESGSAAGTPDLNDLVSTDVPDSVIRSIIMADPCLA